MAVYTKPTYEEILDHLITQAKVLMTTIGNWRVGGVIHTLLAVVAKGLGRLYDVVDTAIANAFPDTATGAHLARWATLLYAPVQAAVKTEGRVVFGRATAGGAVSIPAGRVVGTAAMADGVPRRFVVVTTTTLEDGELEVEAPVIAQSAGARYNVGNGQINVLVTSIPGITFVRNDDGWIDVDGSDAETEATVQARLPLALARLNTAGIGSLYEAVARGVTGVRSAKSCAHLVEVGRVEVLITSDADDAQPSALLIETVQAAIGAVKPDEATVVVGGPSPVAIDVTLTVIRSLVSPSEASLRAAVLIAIDDLFLPSTNLRAFATGNGFVRATLAAAIMQVTGVANVNVIEPAIDVSVDPDELLRPGTVAVTIVGA